MHIVCYMLFYAMLYSPIIHSFMLVFAYSLHNVYLYINIGLAQKRRKQKQEACASRFFVTHAIVNFL